MKLLLSQKNDMYRLINQHSLSHDEFHYSECRRKRHRLHARIDFARVDDYSFVIVNYGGKLFKTRQSPSQNKYHEELTHDGWINVLHQFDHWLCCLKHEMAQPDLWAKGRSNLLRYLFSGSVKGTVSRIWLAGRF